MKIGASGCKAICGALERNTNVADWTHISTWIQSRSAVVLLGFWLKGGRVVMSACWSVPLGRSVVTRFGVADDDFGEEGGRAIARMLELNSSITNLWFRG